MVTTSFDSCRTDCLLVTSNLRSATVAFTTELDTLIPYLLLDEANSKYTEEKSADSFCEADCGKND